jgi:enoyl-CoA hydratase/carnithine racemase
MVLCGGEKFFSIGFDLPALIKMNRPEMSDFFYKFSQLTLDLYAIPFPSACVISGHAIAGGNILALTCDYRFAAAESKKIGLNEIKLGVPVPYLADMILRQIVGERAATRMMYSGEFISLADAASIGLIDETCPAERLKQTAIERVAGLAALHAQAFSAIKTNRIEGIKNNYKKNSRSKNEIFLDCWFSESTQKTLKTASQKF